MNPAASRIDRLRTHALNLERVGARSDEGELLWYRGWIRHRDADSQIVRRARSKAWQLACSTPVIDPDELIAGKPCFRQLSPDEQAELDHYRRELAPALPQTRGQGSHMAIDYEKLLASGLDGISREISQYRASLDPDNPADLARDQFYLACQDSLSGVLAYAEHYAAHARSLAAEEADDTRRTELEQLASRLERVPRYPAATFAEALQSVQFVTFCLEGLYQLGRPDRYLLPFYQRDCSSGLLTEAQAQELIDCQCILMNEYTGRSLAVGLMVGGRDADGHDVCNDLTRLFLQSISHTRMAYPGIGLCCTSDTPEPILELACRLIGAGYSHPALFNDAVIIRGLSQYGLPPAEACLYIHSTCVEITPVATSAVWVASPYINLLQLLLDVMNDRTHEPPATFADLLEAWRLHLRQTIRREARLQNLIQMERERLGGDPLVSSFVHDCLQRGRDVDQGGARYNWIMPSFVGLANLADSLEAVRHVVYEQPLMDLGQLSDVLSTNFEEQEPLRQMLLNRLPKYGNDQDAVDGLVCQLTRWISEETAACRTWRGDRFIPSLFCWIMHEHLGSRTGASPDGRVCGFPLGDGSGPAQGRERKGPTASILSSTKWCHEPFIGGIAVNLKFAGRVFSEPSLPKLMALVRTFMERGGFELQINVVDRETLLKARQNPEAYQDLVVRVGGYSDYFVRLSPAMQEEVILRSEHEL